MAKETHIKAVLEEYLNLEESLQDFTKEKEEALERYHHLLRSHPPQNNTYKLQEATPIIAAHEEVKELEGKIEKAGLDISRCVTEIKGYLHALNGAALHVRFVFDELEHRAGDHTFFLEGEEVKTVHRPVS